MHTNKFLKNIKLFRTSSKARIYYVCTSNDCIYNMYIEKIIRIFEYACRSLPLSIHKCMVFVYVCSYIHNKSYKEREFRT